MPQVETTNIAFLGLGTMGSPMAQNCVKAGFSVKGWNRTHSDRPLVEQAHQNGVEITFTLQEAIADAQIILTCVSDVQDVEQIILGENGVIHHAQPGTLVIDHSTIGIQAACQLAETLNSQGLRFMDAPVSGGDVGAQNGTLTIMVGGEPTDYQRALPTLQAMGKIIVHCGKVGSGQAVKLCNQVLGAAHMVGLCEAMELAKMVDLDPNLMIEVCSTGAAGSWALSNLGPKITTADFAPGFMVKHILKDLRLVQESLGDRHLPGVALANHLFEQVQDLGGAEQGTQAMIRAYREPQD
jgi:3-hydroxyisobutyrate dehydrogenase